MSSFRGSCFILRSAVVCGLIAATAFIAPAQAPAGNATPFTAMTPAAREEADKGLDAFRSAHFDEAIAHFQRAVELDPDSILAKSYLGTTLSQQVVPGLDTPGNLKTAHQAIDILKLVLEKSPHNATVMKQIAAVYIEIKQLDESKAWQKKALIENPQDAEVACTIGLIDWMEAQRNLLAGLTAAGIYDDGKGNAKAPAEVMAAINAKNAPLIEEGMKYLSEAVQLRPNYDDAMAYLSQLYRLKANLDRDNEAAREDDLNSAHGWIEKWTQIREYKETRGVPDAGTGVSSGAMESILTVPPPPPPPPAPGQPLAGVMGHQSNNDSTFGVAGVEGGLPNPGVPCSISSSDSAPNAQATPPNKINISAGVAVGLLCERFQPIYPLIAKAAHVSGTVVLQATISKTGYVENLRVVSGPAMLQQAALDAVKNWRYRPYLLNNEPVEVETTVNVIFTLGDSGAVGSASGNDSTPGVASGTDSCHPNPDAKEPPPKRVTISSGVAAGLLIRKTPPISPPFSLVAHQIETVVLKIIISKTGEVESRRVVSGPATRRQAALDAVKDWHYKPYLINCKPVEVETTVTIAFLPDK